MSDKESVLKLGFDPFTIERIDGQIMMKDADGCWHDLPQAQAIALRDWLNANVGGKVRHIARGGTYNVVRENVTLQTDVPLKDMDRVSVYVAHDGSWWARRRSEMTDGRYDKA